MIKVISEVGSINKAAEMFNVSQPTLSKKVSRLEQKIKMELFNRDNIGMVPTRAAKLLISEGEELSSLMSGIERKLELMSNKVGGTVRVGVGPIIEQIILPKVLLDFVDQNYRFKIAVTTMSQQMLLDQLRNSEIDMAIGPFSSEEVPDDVVVPLETSDKLIVVVRNGHELLAQDKISLTDFTRYKSVSPDVPKSLGTQVMKLIENSEFGPEVICENYNLAKTIVANSDYVVAGPESLFRKELESGELCKLEFQAEVLWHCKCLTKPENLLVPMVKEVVDIFAQYMTVCE